MYTYPITWKVSHCHINSIYYVSVSATFSTELLKALDFYSRITTGYVEKEGETI